jgi:NitT/TauT family transport system substrate-binding protein
MEKARWRHRTATIFLALALVIAVGLGGYFWHSGTDSLQAPPSAGPRPKISLGVNFSELSSLVWIAEEKGYFREQGIEATVKIYQSGIFAMEALIAGEVDLATAADFVFVQKIMAGKDNLHILAAIAETMSQELVVRKDRGILRPGDLKGKRVAVARGTVGEYFLGAFLTLQGLDLEDVEVIDLKPVDMEAALTAGQVDAAVTWEPHLFAIKTHLGERVAGWRDQSSRYFWLLGTTREVIQAKGEALGRVLRALAQAAAWISRHNREAQEMMRRRLGFEAAYADRSWAQGKYALFFNQALLLHMEDQARWLNRRATGKKAIPNFLDYLEPAPLQQAAPQAIKVIVPGKIK